MKQCVFKTFQNFMNITIVSLIILTELTLSTEFVVTSNESVRAFLAGGLSDSVQLDICNGQHKETLLDDLNLVQLFRICSKWVNLPLLIKNQ